MIEISVNEEPERGHFAKYGNYRSMAIGRHYRIEMTVMASGGSWWRTIPWMVVFQGHAIPDAADRGEKYNPPFSLVIQKGRWYAHVRADSRLALPNDRKYERADRYDLGPIREDAWTTFAFDVVWGFMDAPLSPSGSLSLTRDGRLVHTEKGIKNFYNNQDPQGQPYGPYLTFGAYTRLDLIEQDALVRFSKIMLQEFDE